MRAATKRKLRKSLFDNWGYLLLALVVVGWYLFGTHNPLLLAVASFFTKNVLPELTARKAIIEHTDNSLMDVPESAF